VTDPEKVAEAVVAAMMRSDRASAHAGISVVSVAPGAVTVAMTVGEQHVNGHDVCHGGVLFLLADTAFALALNSYGPKGVAAGGDIVFARPARLGDQLVATAIERVRFGRSGVFDVTVSRDDDVIAEFRGRSRTVGESQPGSDGVMVT
jgi:acyl-CoA thioesterase